MRSLSAKQLTTDLLIRYGFQILGALVILGVGLLLARYVGNLTGRWLERRSLEPPVRSLMVKTVRVVVLIFTLVVALDKFGFQVAPAGGGHRGGRSRRRDCAAGRAGQPGGRTQHHPHKPFR